MARSISDAGDEDDLIARLRERIADPQRRADARATEFSASVSRGSFGELVVMGRGVAADLQRLLAQGVDEEIATRVDALETSILPRDLPVARGLARGLARPPDAS